MFFHALMLTSTLLLSYLVEFTWRPGPSEAAAAHVSRFCIIPAAGAQPEHKLPFRAGEARVDVPRDGREEEQRQPARR